ncbi:DinB family protein [Oceanobacillus piezotolerans]|uniref:DinB family protein n=1 Tax=Oceanobacillus piezotolerans TaxID=2448030 RepID=A0A498DG74_9BACI|nr:DinB family protein [Oceanobacillus piezotolerans]RLL43632.1 DinB family protein [Oceanobacillus piezotolerans]
MNEVVLGKLKETRAHLINEISRLQDDNFNKRPDMNKWSIAQVCHHLILVERSTMKVIQWGLKGKSDTNSARKKVELILNRDKKIKAPQIVEPAEETFTVQQIINLLKDSREKLFALLHSIDDKSVLREKSVKHPAFGDLPLDQWVEAVYLHEQRHLEQIKEIKNVLKS